MNKPRLSYSRSSVIISRPVLAVSLLLCVIAAFFGQTALAAALMFVFLLALAARVWAQLSARRLDFSIKSPAGGVFPEELIRNFIKLKRAEAAELARIPHPAEFDRYYNL